MASRFCVCKMQKLKNCYKPLVISACNYFDKEIYLYYDIKNVII